MSEIKMDKDAYKPEATVGTAKNSKHDQLAESFIETLKPPSDLDEVNQAHEESVSDLSPLLMPRNNQTSKTLLNNAKDNRLIVTEKEVEVNKSVEIV